MMLLSSTQDLLKYDTVREALLYEKLSDRRTKCGLCERRCELGPGKEGVCKTRVNIEGRLFTLVYGDVSALESRPIEIKPFFHYWPGSAATTFSTWSCNFSCTWCQNHHLSRSKPNPETARYVPPQAVVDSAVTWGDQGICVSFQEPTIMTDFSVDVFRLASRAGLYCCFVSNGYMTLETLRLLKDSGMTGLKIDVKGDADAYRRLCGGVDVEKVWRNAGEARSIGLHVEIVNLVVTDVNDDEACLEEVIDRHLKELGPEIPLHFTRYYPAHGFKNPPTETSTLEGAYEMARAKGVLYPYLGNLRGHPYEDTYCPGCGGKLIERHGYRILNNKVTTDRACPKCGRKIPIVGEILVG